MGANSTPNCEDCNVTRFADEKLQIFYQEFEDLKDKFESHRMETHELHNQLLAAIKDNTTAVASLAQKTEDIIEVWEALQGVNKIARWLGSTIKWFAGVVVAAGAVWYWLKGGR